MSDSSYPANLKSFLASRKRRRHPSIGCRQFDLEVDDSQCQGFCSYMGNALREAYVDPKYLASVLKREGFEGVAKLLNEKFPSGDDRLSLSVRIGDFGEVVSQVVFQDLFGMKIPVLKLRYKTNWEKASFGIDVIAFRLDDKDSSKDTVVFAEVKTSKSKKYGVAKVFQELEELVVAGQSEAKQKMRNAVRFVSERLFEQGEFELEKRIYRFLDCYTNPEYVEAFVPFLVREKGKWAEDALDGVALNSLEPDRVRLFVFLVSDLKEAIQAAYQMAAKIG